MPRVICVANQKGGVGKTTTAANLAAALAISGATSLLVDLDPQCNATSGLGIEPAACYPLFRDSSAPPPVSHKCMERLHVLPGCRNLNELDRIAGLPVSSFPAIQQSLARVIAGYEYVLIDCPPSLGRVTQVALACADEVLIPIQCEYFAMEGLTQMIEIVRRAISSREGKLQFGGILLTMYDHSLPLTLEVEKEVRDFFGEIVFENVIPRDVVVSEAPSHGQSAVVFAPRSRGARAYVELCMEVTDRE